MNLVPWDELGFEVAGEFGDGDEAFTWLEANPCDAVLSDIQMRRMNGLELAARLNKESPQIKVVLLSGYRIFEYARQAIQCQVVDYLLKPVDEEELAAVFHNIRDMLDRENEAARLELDLSMTGSPEEEGLAEQFAALEDEDLSILRDCDPDRDEQTFRSRLQLRYLLLMAMLDLDRAEMLMEEVERVTELLGRLDIEASVETAAGIYRRLTDAYAERGVDLMEISEGAFSHCRLERLTDHEALAERMKRDVTSLNERLRAFRAERYTDMVGNVVRYIEHNVGSDLSGENIATMHRASFSYVSRVFRQKTGEKMSDFIARVRIQNSMLLMKENHEEQNRMAQISRLVGYKTPSYFATMFRKLTGLSPREFCNQVLVP